MIQPLQQAAWCKRYLGRSEPDLYPVAAPHLFHVRYQPRGHVIHWQHFAHAAQPDCFFGHAEDHAAILILGNGQGAVLLHGQHALPAILAHPGQQHACSTGAARGRHRIKHHIDCRLVPVNWFCIG